jgi:hypothetical protein
MSLEKEGKTKSISGNTLGFVMLNMCKTLRSSVVAFVLLGCCWVSSAIAVGDMLHWKDGGFYIGSSLIDVRSYGRGLAKLVDLGDVVVFPGRVYPFGNFLVYVSKPTRPLPMHRCGSGTEGYLALLKHRSGRLLLVDHVRIQSCEEGVFVSTSDFEIPLDASKEIQISGNVIAYLSTYPNFARRPEELEAHKYEIVGDRFIVVRKID